MVVARHKGDPPPCAAFGEDPRRKAEVFFGGMALVLQKDLFGGDSLFQQVVPHRGRFGDSLVAPLSAADDQQCFSLASAVQLQRKIEASGQYTGDLVAADKRAAVDDHCVKGALARQEREQKHIQDEGQQQRRDIKDGRADGKEDRPADAGKHVKGIAHEE